jgi:hypothetical protein
MLPARFHADSQIFAQLSADPSPNRSATAENESRSGIRLVNWTSGMPPLAERELP